MRGGCKGESQEMEKERERGTDGGGKGWPWVFVFISDQGQNMPRSSTALTIGNQKNQRPATKTTRTEV